MAITSTTSLRTFEDWGECDDAIRSGYPSMHLSDEDIAARQAELDAARRDAARPTTYYDLDEQDKANFKELWPERTAILEAPIKPVTPPPAISADPWADPQTRLELAAHNLEVARAEFEAAAAALRQHQQAEAAKRAAFAQVRRQVRTIEDRYRLHQSHIESAERLSAQLGPNTGFQLMR